MKEPNKEDLLREIATTLIQVYQNNLTLKKIEKILQDMRRSEMSRSSAKGPTPVESSDDE